MNKTKDYSIAFPARDAFYQGLSPSFYRDHASFREIYEIASCVLNQDLYKISYLDPSQKPELHTICLIVHCYGIYQILSDYLPLPKSVMGFSQGEFTAITAAECIELSEILNLVYRLEELVIKNESLRKGAMMRVVGLAREQLIPICHEVRESGEVVSIAIYLSKDQNIISGSQEGISRASEKAKATGARWVIPISTGGAFHSSLCDEINENSNHIFCDFQFKDPIYPVYTCVDGNSNINGMIINEKLSKQISKPIHWDKIIYSLYDNRIMNLLELGPGCTVSGNSRIICPELNYSWINNTKDLFNIVEDFSI